MNEPELNDEPEFRTVAQAAKLLKVHPTRVRQYCREGRITGARIVGRDWLIPKIDVEVFALQHKTYRAGRPKIDREMLEICRRYKLPNDIVITPEEKEAIDENIECFLRLTPAQRQAANDRVLSFDRRIRRGRRTAVRS